jgi:hypothetical protein
MPNARPRHQQRAPRHQRWHGAEFGVSRNREQQHVNELGEFGHEPDHDAREGADHGRQGDQPHLVRAHQRAQNLGRVHDHVAERPAMPLSGDAGGSLGLGRAFSRMRLIGRTRKS